MLACCGPRPKLTEVCRGNEAAPEGLSTSSDEDALSIDIVLADYVDGQANLPDTPVFTTPSPTRRSKTFSCSAETSSNVENYAGGYVTTIVDSLYNRDTCFAEVAANAACILR
ncbi:hypothetical protein MTO96_041645 [Rhipicephalus appendiculatus]